MSFHFDVAISYLTGDSSHAAHLKRQLSDRFSLCTFIYSHEQATLAAQGIEDGLAVVFERQSRVVIVLYREGWGSTGGPLIEKRAITRRRNRSDDRFLLVLNLASDLSAVPWKDEQFYYDLNAYPLDGAIEAAARLVKRHREAFESSSIAIVSRPPEPAASEEALREELRNWLVSDFFETGNFEGHFGANGGAAEATRWRMASARMQIRGYGFITGELIARLITRPGVKGKLVHVFAETIHYAGRRLSRLPVSKHETPEEKQRGP